MFAAVNAWWKRAFPGREERADLRTARLGPLLLLVVAGLLFYSRLGCALLEPEEARYAEIPRQMLAEGTFITPVLHGEEYYQKPPLLYWLVMLCYRVFGVQDWAARLVPATAGVLTVLTTWYWALRTVGPRAALFAGLILSLSPRFLYLAGMLGMDPLLCLWVIAGLTWGHQAIQGKGRWTLLLSAVCCGLGVLTKGPVAVALVLGPLATLAILDGRCRALRWSGWLLLLGVTLTVAAPWYVAVILRDPDAAANFFWLHNVVRYLAPFDHEQPAWYFLPSLVFGIWPWTLLLPPLLVYLVRSSRARRRPAALGGFLVPLVACVGFFSLSGCKRPGYILPAFPLLALVLGTYLARAFSWRLHGAHPRLAPLLTSLQCRMGLTVLLATWHVAIVLAWLPVFLGVWPWQLALGMTVAAHLVTLAAWAARRRFSPQVIWVGVGASAFVLWIATAHFWLPHYHRQFSLRGQVRRHLDTSAVDGVACFPKRWDSVPFYLRRPVDVLGDSAELTAFVRERDTTLLFVKNGPALQELLEALPPDREFVRLGRQSRKVSVGIVQRK